MLGKIPAVFTRICAEKYPERSNFTLSASPCIYLGIPSAPAYRRQAKKYLDVRGAESYSCQTLADY
jgi:hypothetical protein